MDNRYLLMSLGTLFWLFQQAVQLYLHKRREDKLEQGLSEIRQDVDTLARRLSVVEQVATGSSLANHGPHDAIIYFDKVGNIEQRLKTIEDDLRRQVDSDLSYIRK